MTGFQRVAVLCYDGRDAHVWSIIVGRLVDARESRLSGAWTLPIQDVAQLHIWASCAGVVVSGYDGEQLSADLGSAFPRLDLEAIGITLREEVARLQIAYEKELASRPKAAKLLPPRWPQDTSTASTASSMRSSGNAECLRLARTVAQLADAWDQIEKERTARPFLHGDLPQPRPFPL